MGARLLYRFSPANMGYGRGYLQYGGLPDGAFDGMSETQRAVLEPPYGTRLDRPLVAAAAGGEVSTHVKPRSATKKDFDRQLFGTDYF